MISLSQIENTGPEIEGFAQMDFIKPISAIHPLFSLVRKNKYVMFTVA